MYVSRGKSQSLFAGDIMKPKVPMVGALPRNPSPPLPPSPPLGERMPTPVMTDRLVVHDDEAVYNENLPHRSAHELFKVNIPLTLPQYILAFMGIHV